ncbi:hypothetical protein BP5796_06298 [Coleophoma crateriformis]|uniref:Uncharacterized protein n=1 Tax=Coleophoma crateriformis TaxID=565419 RepID=A0A3D8RWT0_9HELO|nr:hypothetical protein BP5796_06298 [Coleophoma crateriformis]
MANTSPVGRKLLLHHWLEDQLSSPTNASSHRPYASTLAEVARIEMDDPWDWETDRIVQELCTNERSWQHRRGKMPDAMAFEAALRGQDITGDILLVELNDAVMKEDLGLKAIQGRAFVRGAIEELRARSLKYQDWWEKHDPINVGSYYSRSMQEHSLPQLSKPAPRTGLATSPNQTPDSTRVEANSPIATLYDRGGSKSLGFPRAPHDNIEGHSNKRRKLDGTSSEVHLDDMREDSPQYHDALVLQDDEERHGADVTSSTEAKQRKRIAPTLLTSVLDPNRDRSLPTDADNVVIHAHHTIKPGVAFIDEAGRKRLVPIHQESPTCTEPYNLANFRKSKARRDSVSKAGGYLGKNKMLVDNIFYEDIEFGQDLPSDSDVEISLVSGGSSGGQRLYVHGIMKHFLQVDRKNLVRGGKHFSAVLPYPTRLAPKYHDPSFTLYSKTSDGCIQAKRERLPAWPELDPEGPSETMPSKEPIFAAFTGSYEEWDPSYLEKYRFIEGGDTILPLYGESDEENEFDPETWAEIEAERGDLPKLKMALRRQHITAAEVSQAIDEGIAELKAKWKAIKLPRLQRKAWRIWVRSRRENNKRQRIKAFEARINHINDRISKMCTEITKDTWTSQQQVRSQTRIMETSIFELEELAWEISVLVAKTMPDKLSVPEPIPALKQKNLVDHGEDGESLDSSQASSSDDEDLRGFVIEDGSECSSVAQELDLATNKSDEGSDTDVVENRLLSNADINGPLHHASSLPNRRPNMKSGASLPSHQKNSAIDDIVDLTLLSSSSDSEVVNLVAPTRKFLKSPPTRRVKVKLDLRSKVTANTAIAISDTDDISISEQAPDCLPPLSDPEAICSKIDAIWIELGDRARLLLSILYRELEAQEKTKLIEFLKDMPEETLWSRIINTARLLSGKEDRMKGLDAQSLSILRLLIRMLLIYIDCKPVDPFDHNTVLLASQVTKIRNSRTELFRAFYKFCCKLGHYFWARAGSSNIHKNDKENTKLQAGGQRQPRLSTTSDDDLTENDSPRKRRKPLHEDASARDLRIQDRERQAEQEQRRQRLRAKLAESGNVAGVDPSRIIINEGKFDDQGYVYVNDYIGRRIKPHQVSGVQFMWSQIVTDHKVMHGCLLAHTMGLGKTMQSITLLIAIAEASASEDETVRAQVPLGLRISKTLILCPPGLIDNWMDEFLMWTPKDLLGELRKIDAAVKTLKARLIVIEEWYRDGGILIIGYDMFRSLIQNGTRKDATSAPLTEEQHEKVKQHLLEGPNIIIADEAHKMKNATSQLTAATSQFKSKTRIALTGSPLANNVEEYHTMIEWVAPNYLGPITEFRQKYVHPIQDGLFFDSTHAERRKSLKMLGVLKEDLSPKVHRADMSVLRNDLPPKAEFVMFLRLTDLQKEAYALYVRSMMPGAGNITQSTLWHWLAILSLLCNHPSCFRAKLTERKEDAVSSQKAASRPYLTEEGDINVWKTGVSEELVRQELALLDQEPDLSFFDLSNKVKILCQILDASRLVGDKVLVFSSSIPTLDYLQIVCEKTGRKWARLDGSTQVAKRQGLTKEFNTSNKELYLISTTAGGLGLNLPSANRVVIFDFKWNPIAEEQAVGRAYRIGQKKRVFVYRFVVAGTFEEVIHNKAIFKMQLSQRVVDKKNPVAWAKKHAGEFLFEPKDVLDNDLDGHIGKDPNVLDAILAEQKESRRISSIIQNDTFEQVADDLLTAEDRKEIEQLLSDEQLKRSNPIAYRDLTYERQKIELELRIQAAAAAASRQMQNTIGRPPSTPQAIVPSASMQASNNAVPVNGQIPSNNARVIGQTILPPLPAITTRVNRPGLEPVRATGTRIREEDRSEIAPLSSGTPSSGKQRHEVPVASTDGTSDAISKPSQGRSSPAEASSSLGVKSQNRSPEFRLTSALQRAAMSGVSPRLNNAQDICDSIARAAKHLTTSSEEKNKAIDRASEEIDKTPATGLALMKKSISAKEFVQGVLSQMRSSRILNVKGTPRNGMHVGISKKRSPLRQSLPSTSALSVATEPDSIESSNAQSISDLKRSRFKTKQPEYAQLLDSQGGTSEKVESYESERAGRLEAAKPLSTPGISESFIPRERKATAKDPVERNNSVGSSESSASAVQEFSLLERARMFEAMDTAAGPKSRQDEDALATAQINRRRAALRAPKETSSPSQESALPEWALQNIRTRTRSHRSQHGTPTE